MEAMEPKGYIHMIREAMKKVKNRGSTQQPIEQWLNTAITYAESVVSSEERMTFVGSDMQDDPYGTWDADDSTDQKPGSKMVIEKTLWVSVPLGIWVTAEWIVKHTAGSIAQELDGLIDECFFVPSVDSSMAAIHTDSSERLEQAQKLKLFLESGTKSDVLEHYNLDHSKDICLVLFQYLQKHGSFIPERKAQGLKVVYFHVPYPMTSRTRRCRIDMRILVGPCTKRLATRNSRCRITNCCAIYCTFSID